MSQKRLSMRKIRELMRLTYELGRSHRARDRRLARRRQQHGERLRGAGEGGGALPAAA